MKMDWAEITLQLQSQSKLLGHFAVFLPSQCWCTRFGKLTLITNIGLTRRMAKREKKNSVGWKCPNLFLSETVADAQLRKESFF